MYALIMMFVFCVDNNNNNNGMSYYGEYLT